MSDRFKWELPKVPGINFGVPQFPKIDFAAIERERRERQAVDLGYAHVMFERLVAQIEEFEATIQPDEEIAAYLASFGTRVIVAIDDVGYHNPYFITFDGVNVDTHQRVRLVQHVSQLSVLFTAAKVPKEENRKPRRIGFHVDEGTAEENSGPKDGQQGG